jgi:hypothetical protein
MINRHVLFVLLASASVAGCGETAGDRPAAGVTPASSSITTWLDSFGKGAMTDEAAAFMYMQLALEEMPVDGQE